jgi:transcriptional regulator with XRE-family HTH domain
MLKLKEIRHEKGIKQDDFAKMLGIHRITLSKIENEKIKINQDKIIELSNALDVSPDILLDYNGAYRKYVNYLMSLKEEKK